jgi:phosphatidylinositol alpha-1,6-mannosyltransferase
MKILFVTRKFPPSTGGMENAAYELYEELAKDNDVRLVKWGGSAKWLFLVYPILFLRGLYEAIFTRPDAIYLQDGVMAPLGWTIKKFTGVPSLLTVHGLEATYDNPVYKKTVRPFIGKQTRIAAVSQETKKEIEKIVPGKEITVIHNGLKDAFYSDTDKEEHLRLISEATGISVPELKNTRILHTNGRLVERKGVDWFINNVMPELKARFKNRVVYIVTGDGNQRENIENSVKKQGMEGNVRILGRVDNEVLRALYNRADIFLMPNIRVKNDMEGFGLVALEAASCGRLVIASELEGIKDAIKPRKNGLLTPAGNKKEYLRLIIKELSAPSLIPNNIRRYTLENYSWKKTAQGYLDLINGMKQTG